MANKDQKADEDKEFAQKKAIRDAIGNINKVLVPDQDGVILVSMPIGRNQETGKMEFGKIPHSEKDVPPEEVLYYAGSVIMDAHTSHSETVEINGIRDVVVFDRNYSHGKKRYQLAAWIPKKSIMAGVLFEKKINPQTRQPMAVLKKLADGKTPRYQIVGGKEADYRDLRRIFERIWLRKGVGGEQDDELSRFMYNSIEPIAEEIAT